MSSLIERVKEKYWTAGEAAKIVGVNYVTMWRWIRKGNLKAERLGREVLVEKQTVEALKRR